MKTHSRRHFLKSASLISLAAIHRPSKAQEIPAPDFPLQGRLHKTLKYGMTRKWKTMPERFAAAKAAGFAGIEMAAPGFDINEVSDAINETGLPVDGCTGKGQWTTRHTDPDPKVRAEALSRLLQGLRQTKAVGGHSLLVVIGHGKDGSEKEIWQRSINNIRQAVPLAAELGVALVIENVWNHFCYDHEGGSSQTADKFARYVDEFQSPWVGMQFDIGNHWKYGSMGDWIRTLNKRIIKLDVKGFSRKKDSFTKIGEGDLDFADVRKALVEIDYHGWCAAEVKGGDADRLREISDNMDRVFGLKT